MRRLVIVAVLALSACGGQEEDSPKDKEARQQAEICAGSCARANECYNAGTMTEGELAQCEEDCVSRIASGETNEACQACFAVHSCEDLFPSDDCSRRPCYNECGLEQPHC